MWAPLDICDCIMWWSGGLVGRWALPYVYCFREVEASVRAYRRNPSFSNFPTYLKFILRNHPVFKSMKSMDKL